MRLLAGGTEHRERLVAPHEGGVLKVWRGGGVREEGRRKVGDRRETKRERREERRERKEVSKLEGR